jgi:hypothetical protein
MLLSLLLALQAQAVTPATPLHENLGRLHRPISTTVVLAQRYFDQGLILTYGLNHAEAINSFREAARLTSAAPWERAYIEAVAARYSADTTKTRPSLG